MKIKLYFLRLRGVCFYGVISLSWLVLNIIGYKVLSFYLIFYSIVLFIFLIYIVDYIFDFWSFFGILF